MKIKTKNTFELWRSDGFNCRSHKIFRPYGHSIVYDTLEMIELFYRKRIALKYWVILHNIGLSKFTIGTSNLYNINNLQIQTSTIEMVLKKFPSLKHIAKSKLTIILMLRVMSVDRWAHDWYFITQTSVHWTKTQ